MTDDKVKRRLTTVLCADVHGYSRLMEADEAGTLGTLRRHRAAIAGLVARHDGRIVNTWGDAVIAEFASVVEAVQCAVEIQQEGLRIPPVLLSAGARLLTYALPLLWLSTAPGFRIQHAWYLSIATTTLQAGLSVWLLHLEFRKRLLPLAE